MKTRYRLVVSSAALIILVTVFHATILRYIGHFLIEQNLPQHAQASVVLSTGNEYPHRLVEAAELFNSGTVERIVINGNRKTSLIKQLEAEGYEPAAPWYENSLRILEQQGAPREKVVIINAEDVYDTISETKTVCDALLSDRITDVIVTTSKYHTKRASMIWKSLCPELGQIYTAGARRDSYDPNSWWKEGRQIRWVLAEYGAWLYFLWRNFY